MYQTNLSWKVSEKYISKLHSRGFLQIHHSHTKYATTKKGMQFLEKWIELTELLSMRSKKDVLE
jgi:predicted transcriptional regulator